MIVTRTPTSYRVIVQQAHAMLATQAALHLHPDLQPRMWADTLIAIATHDDHQHPHDHGEYLDARGAPVDFEDDPEPASSHLRQARLVVQSSGLRSGFTQLLIIQHMQFLYSHYAEHNEQWHEFMDFLNKQSLHLQATLDMTPAQAHESYEVLRFFDRLSLILCREECRDDGREVEVNTSIRDVQYMLSQENKVYTIEPWPFYKDEFEVQLEVRHIRELSFVSGDAFAKAITKTPVTRESFHFKQPSTQ